ncbi:MAG: hypothetical protein EBX52_02890 [Proteobacteria bacterium]|nr:hypothetical protein [Pseudomonadota bacterium]
MIRAVSSDRHWLITAFEPFAGRSLNASMAVQAEIGRIAEHLEPSPSGRFCIHFKVLPVEYDRCFEALMQTVEEMKSSGIRLEGVLSIGEGDEDFKIETQANNLDDVEGFPDNRGVIRENQKIFPDLDEEAVIPLRFPFEAFSRIRTSKNPGYFICNHLCARMGRQFGSDPNAPWFGFIHVPKTGHGGIFTPDIIATLIVNGLKKIG